MEKVLILIIDDDPSLRMTLDDILKFKGYATLVAKDGAEGLALMQNNDIDLALIDLGLPDISGFDVLSRIKAEYPSTAVIILTGNSALNSAIEATNRGAFSYLVKPYEIEQLLLQIKRAIEKQQTDQEQEILLARLLQSQKLESVGRLAAGIAHEINTPIQFLSSNINFIDESFIELSRALTEFFELLDSVKKGAMTEVQIKAQDDIVARLDWDYLKEEIPLAISQSKEGIQRVATIVQAMKEFSHPGGKQKINADLNRIIETTITVSRNEWIYVATVETDLDPELETVPCLPDEMGQVFLNLLVNAAHAIEDKHHTHPEGEKGRIMFSTRQDDHQLEIRITDTGGGIPQHIQDKIFDPFFTTKEVGKGTGQGLAIAHDVITGKHNGTLVFTTELGIGTTFIIRLPRGSV